MLALALAVMAAPATGVSPRASSVADAFLTATKACADYAERGRAALSLSPHATAPAYVADGAARLGFGTPSFFRVAADAGEVWVIVFEGDSMCLIQAYALQLAHAEPEILAAAAGAGWAVDASVPETVRGPRKLKVYETMRSGRRIQLVMLTPLDYNKSGGVAPPAISGYVEAVDKGK